MLSTRSIKVKADFDCTCLANDAVGRNRAAALPAASNVGPRTDFAAAVSLYMGSQTSPAEASTPASAALAGGDVDKQGGGDVQLFSPSPCWLAWPWRCAVPVSFVASTEYRVLTSF